MTAAARRRHAWLCGAISLVVLASCGADQAESATPASTSPSAPASSTMPVSTPASALPVTSPAPVMAPPATVVPVASSIAPAATEPATTVVETTVVETTVAPVRSGADVNVGQPVGDPLSISIPSIGVESELVGAGLLEDGTVAVPPDPDIAGWFSAGPRPGERGPAVIMGHVDSKKSGPGVFWHLVDLEVGAEVIVRTTTGDQRFIVTSREQVPKNEFPTERVYGAVPEPALRLITCGGSFDRSIGHYRDNIVVYLQKAP